MKSNVIWKTCSERVVDDTDSAVQAEFVAEIDCDGNLCPDSEMIPSTGFGDESASSNSSRTSFQNQEPQIAQHSEGSSLLTASLWASEDLTLAFAAQPTAVSTPQKQQLNTESELAQVLHQTPSLRVDQVEDVKMSNTPVDEGFNTRKMNLESWQPAAKRDLWLRGGPPAKSSDSLASLTVPSAERVRATGLWSVERRWRTFQDSIDQQLDSLTGCAVRNSNINKLQLHPPEGRGPAQQQELAKLKREVARQNAVVRILLSIFIAAFAPGLVLSWRYVTNTPNLCYFSKTFSLIRIRFQVKSSV